MLHWSGGGAARKTSGTDRGQHTLNAGWAVRAGVAWRRALAGGMMSPDMVRLAVAIGLLGMVGLLSRPEPGDASDDQAVLAYAPNDQRRFGQIIRLAEAGVTRSKSHQVASGQEAWEIANVPVMFSS
jgi:hypothetical protein